MTNHVPFNTKLKQKQLLYQTTEMSSFSILAVHVRRSFEQHATVGGCQYPTQKSELDHVGLFARC